MPLPRRGDPSLSFLNNPERLPLRFQTGLAGLVVALAVAGCSSAPIANVSDAAVTGSSGKPLNRDQVLNESAGKIHKNYNGWIQNLTRGINANLSAS